MQFFGRTSILALFIGGFTAVALSSAPISARQRQPATSSTPLSGSQPAAQAVVNQYCVTCHNERLKTGGISLDALDATKPGSNAEVWERVIAKLRAGSMPPAGRPRPDVATYHAVANWLE